MRWTLIAGAPTATERDGERLLRALREITDNSPVPAPDRCQPRCRLRRRHGTPATVHLHRDGRHDEPRRPPDDQGRTGRDPRRGAAVRLVRGDVRGARRWNRSASRARSSPCAPTSWARSRRSVTRPSAKTRTAAGTSSGASAELDELASALEAGGTVELVGEAGIGKTPAVARGAGTDGERPTVGGRASRASRGDHAVRPVRALRAAGGGDRRSDQRRRRRRQR